MKSLPLSLLLALTAFSEAGVNLKNGNFFISYDDLIVSTSDRSDLRIRRTYNSKSTAKTTFGFGWAELSESKLVDTEDYLVFHEHGAGGTRPIKHPGTSVDPSLTKADLAEALQVRSVTQNEKFLNRLIGSQDLRASYLSKGFGGNSAHGKKGISRVALSPLTYCTAETCNDLHGSFAFEKNSQIVRKFWDTSEEKLYGSTGFAESFSGEDGREALEFKRRNNGRLERITQGDHYLLFFYDENEKLSRIESDQAYSAEYQIDGKDRLNYSKDAVGNEYWYEYDDHHNLTKIRYSAYDPNDAMEITYHKENFHCASKKDRNGDFTRYDYDSSIDAPRDHYWTLVSNSPRLAPPSTERHEFKINTQSGGIRSTAEKIITRNGITTHQLFDKYGFIDTEKLDAIGIPEMKLENDLLVEVDGPLNLYIREHHPTQHYLTDLKITHKASQKQFRWTFDYTQEGEAHIMTHAKSSQGSVKISQVDRLCVLSDGATAVYVDESGNVSLDQKQWFKTSFKRFKRDGLFETVLTTLEEKPASDPKLENFLGRYRLPLGASAQQFLPSQLNKIVWHSHDL